METTINIVTFTLLIGLILSPVFIVWRLNKLNVKNKFIIYMTIGVLTTGAITLTFAWWAYISNQMLLEHYGYNFHATNDTERFGKVSSVNLQRVKSLEISNMGIGWPLKAILTYIIYTPYLLIVYLVTYLFSKILLKRKSKTNDIH
jgi:hypothetical protein